jgi:hypothetical protein
LFQKNEPMIGGKHAKHSHWDRLFSFAGASQASSITAFTDRPAFGTAVGATTTETFGPSQCFPLTAPLNNASSYGCLPAGIIQPGATYSAPIVPGLSFDIDTGPSFPTPFLDSLLLGRGSAPLTVTFDTPAAALGFDTNSILMGSSFTILFNFVSGSSSLTPSVPAGSGPDFFGFQSSAADIQSVVITGTDPTFFGFGLDNFSFSNTSVVTSAPEPGLFPLVSAALVFLSGAHMVLRSRR